MLRTSPIVRVRRSACARVTFTPRIVTGDADANKERLFDAGVVPPMLAAILAHADHVFIIKAACDTIRNLSVSGACGGRVLMCVAALRCYCSLVLGMSSRVPHVLLQSLACTVFCRCSLVGIAVMHVRVRNYRYQELHSVCDLSCTL